MKNEETKNTTYNNVFKVLKTDQKKKNRKQYNMLTLIKRKLEWQSYQQRGT